MTDINKLTKATAVQAGGMIGEVSLAYDEDIVHQLVGLFGDVILQINEQQEVEAENVMLALLLAADNVAISSLCAEVANEQQPESTEELMELTEKVHADYTNQKYKAFVGDEPEFNAEDLPEHIREALATLITKAGGSVQ
jgi:hypothetical protein